MSYWRMFQKVLHNLLVTVGAVAVVLGSGCAVAPADRQTVQDERSGMAAIKAYLADRGRIESIESVKVNDSELLLIRYILAPTPQSYIRCAVALPKPDVWTGRLIGLGNTGFPSGYTSQYYNWSDLTRSTGFTEHLAGKNNAIATTDMGFSRHRSQNPEVWKDFGFRSTHLMTVTAKEIIRLYYGRPSRYNYFFGLSTGGGQGMHEAQQFPEDYDGIISVVPAATRLYLLASNLHVYRTMHDKNGKALFSRNHLDVIRDAAVKYFADKDPAYAAGRFIADARYTPEAARKIAELAAAMDKSINKDMQQRIEKLFGPIYISGKYAGNSVPFGGGDLYAVGKAQHAMLNMFFGRETPVISLDHDRDLPAVFQTMSPIFNAENPDLSAFRKRGGKLIVYSGNEDCIVPYSAFVDYYQRAAGAAGGIDELKKNFLYYILPGRSHVSGRGLRTLKNIDRIMFDWVEKDIAPDVLIGVTQKGEEYPVNPYPMMTVGDKKQGFSAVPFPEIKTPPRDELFTATLSAEAAQRECRFPNRKIEYPAGKQGKWFGFDRYDFTFENRKAFIVAPKRPAPGLPWLWCLQWPTAFVQRTPTLELLSRGYHYVYIDLHDTRMGIEGIRIARRFYDMLQKLSFAPKAGLSGLSIGGLYALRWAAENPDKVSSIYLDAPMTEPVSGNPRSQKMFEKTYQLQGVDALRNSPLSPNNSCKALSRIPIIAIRHGEDQTVPNARHLDLFAKNFKAAGGKLTVINHKFYGHHPHGLDDPRKLADFIERYSR